jgi:hypothetical protein
MATKTTTKTADIEAAAALVLPELVTIHDVAVRLGVPRVTVEKWVQRSKIDSYRAPAELERGGTMTFAFPDPRLVLANGRTSLWLWQDIDQWLTDTERPRHADGTLVGRTRK